MTGESQGVSHPSRPDAVGEAGHEAKREMNETAEAAATRRRLRRFQLVSIIGLVVVAFAAAAVAGSFLLTAAVLNSDLSAQIRRATGFTTQIHGRAHFVLFPQPHIDIENISFANPGAGLRIDADGFQGILRLLPLLTGRVEVGHAILYGPRMVIDLDDRPMTPESALGRAADAKSASPEAAALDAAPLGIVDLVGGSARLTHHDGRNIFVDDINVSIDWRSLDASATLTGQFDFRKVPMQLKAWFAQPIELLRGGQSAASIHLDAEPLRFSASGTIATGPKFQYQGSLFATAPSLRKVAELAGFPFAKHGRFADLDLRCDANIIGNTAALTNLHLSLDGNDYEGTLAVQADPQKPSLSGTLATSLLDVTPFLKGLPRPRSAYGQWSSEALDLTDLGFANLDLRLSASQLRLNDIKITDAALSVLTRPGYLDLALAEAESNSGTIRGHLTLATHDKALDLRVSGSAAGVDIRPIFRGGEVKHPLLGTLNGSLVLESSGASVDQLMRDLSGRAQLHVTNGQFVGADLAAVLNQKKPPHFARVRDPAASVTNFDAANFGLRITKGTAEVTSGHVQGDSWTIRFGGTANLPGRSLDLWAMAQAAATTPDKPGSKAAPLWLTIKGPWTRLHVTPDQAPPPGLPALPAPSATPGALPVSPSRSE